VRFPCVIVCDRGRELFARLQRGMPDSPWLLRHALDAAECRTFLASGSPAVIVVRSGQAEFELLEWAQGQGLGVRAVMLFDKTDAAAEALAWDLGAAFVLPLQRLCYLVPVVAALARALIPAEET
jgi:hypothetical protein